MALTDDSAQRRGEGPVRGDAKTPATTDRRAEDNVTSIPDVGCAEPTFLGMPVTVWLLQSRITFRPPRRGEVRVVGPDSLVQSSALETAFSVLFGIVLANVPRAVRRVGSWIRGVGLWWIETDGLFRYSRAQNARALAHHLAPPSLASSTVRRGPGDSSSHGEEALGPR